MGLLDKLFKREPKHGKDLGSWQTLTAYVPVFSSWSGELYESELVRAAVDARARHISKLEITVQGSARPALQRRLRDGPNEFQTWSQFLYRLSTILDMQNTAFITPVLNEYGETVGLWPLYCSSFELVDYGGEAWIRFTLGNGSHAALPLKSVGIMNRYQYKQDFTGEKNTALSGTMELINLQGQGIQEAVKNSNSYRFMARANNLIAPEDLVKERKRFIQQNMQNDDSGVLLFPNTWNDIKQVESKPYTVDTEQVKLIQTNVFNYFGVNEQVLQNSAAGDELGAFFDGAVEPFSIQFSEVVTRMLFTDRERANGAGILAVANRLQYMKTKEKINLIQQLGDRGMLMIDEARALLNYAPLPNGAGQRVPIRGEYYFNGEERETDEEARDQSL